MSQRYSEQFVCSGMGTEDTASMALTHIIATEHAQGGAKCVARRGYRACGGLVNVSEVTLVPPALLAALRHSCTTGPQTTL